MTPKEKAEQLTNDLYLLTQDTTIAVRCALFCAKETYNELLDAGILSQYWKEVIKELENV